LSNIVITDTLSSNIVCPSTTLAPGASMTCTGTYVIPKGDSFSSSTDTVTVTGTDSVGGSVSDNSSATVDIIHPAITVVKSVSPTTVDNLQNNTITVSALVTNTGDTTLTGINITDTLSVNVSCPSTTLAPGASMTCTGTYVIPKGYVASSSTDTVTVVGEDQVGGEVSSNSSATVTVLRPALSATCSCTSGTGSVSWTIVVKNTGDTSLNVTVSDTLGHTFVPSPVTLASGASQSYTFTDTGLTPGVPVPDTVTATGSDSLGGTVTATAGSTCTPTGGCKVPTSIVSNFNGTPIAGGNYIWFSSVLELKSPTPSSTLTIHFTGQTITFTVPSGPNAGTYTVSVPDADVVFSTTATTATTTFSGGMFITTVPASYTGNVFLSGLAYKVPAGGFPGGVSPVGWHGTFSGSGPFSVTWKWAAAVYTSFSTNYNSLGIKPVDSSTLSIYHNADHAATPENFKGFVTGGARGGGGSNFTGSYSATKSASCP
jgi:hypothetical protein